MPRPRRTVRATGVVVGLTIAVLVAAGVLLTISHSRSAAQQQRLVVSNYETIATMRSALVVLQDAEIGQRIYLLTGDTANLAPYDRARPRVDSMLRQLEAAIAGDSDALHQVAEFREVANEKFQELNDGIVFQQLYGNSGRPRAPIGRNTTDHLRQVAESFIEGQRLQLARRLAMLRSEQDQADVAGFLVLGGAALCLIAGIFLIVRGSERLEDAQRQLAARTQLLQSTLETLHDPIFVLDAAGDVVAWNGAFVRLAGWDTAREPVLTREHLLSPRLPVTSALLAPLQLDAESADAVVIARASYDGREYECSRGRMAGGGAVIRFVDVTDKLRDEAALRQGQK
ncbi:MAG: CHASE3 domain-containing protein, partial [Alphaproteobacteria bacterium]|nr:CHASE3 domain-containing protein [Alphaproteobacteria bacterium]